MRSPCCLCASVPMFLYVCVSPYELSNAWTNFYKIWYVYVRVYRGTWTHLNSVRNKSLPSVCVWICIPLSLLGNGSVKMLPRQQIHTQQ
jgi:hypothetical protein